MKNILTFLIFLTSALELFTQPHGIHPAWYQSPKIAVASVNADLNGAVANNMVVKGNGTTIFFYRKGNSNYWTGTNDNGVSWDAPAPSLLTTPPPNAATGLSSISADIDVNDNIHILWKSQHFALSYSRYNGVSWSNPVTISTSTITANDTIGFSQITVDRRGIIHLMWQQGNHNNNSLSSSCWYSRSADGGVTFSSVPVKLSGTLPGDAAFPVADFGGTATDTLIITWRHNTSGNPNMHIMDWDVYGAVTRDGGVTWGQPAPIAAGQHHQWDPNTIVDKKGFIHLFFHEYHSDTTGADSTANIHYKFSTDGGTTWSGSHIISEPYRSHLVKTAYDIKNDAVWCVWKDERDATFGNPRADLVGVYLTNNGIPVISAPEFITDHDTMEISYHNFKVGADGIMRAVYNNSLMQGKGDKIYYTQRTPLAITAIKEQSKEDNGILLYPNPTSGNIRINNQNKEKISLKLFNILGEMIMQTEQTDFSIANLPGGIYIAVVIRGKSTSSLKIMKL
ncbi:MAG: T9SS type A sorting domain-containing protein [Ignavibacteriaceae bacterium]|nr:T9SS type A sorting domain-containing protein [Ignavibacteriaceae bacterium]